MVVLDLDIGNTRIKWRCGQQCGALLHTDDWITVFAALPQTPERVRMANVAGSAIGEQVAQWLRAQWGVVAELAGTSNRAAGVDCGYPDPSQLGVDRWLAILASFHKFCRKTASDVVVVSAGSAVTVDLLCAEGRHLGGYIVPGLEMQRRALFAGTSAVKVDGRWLSATMSPGEDTGKAVSNGCLKMVVALIDLARNELGNDVPVILSGGDAGYLQQHLSGQVYCEPELVMDGLSVLMP